jgi:hypothetical protein
VLLLIDNGFGAATDWPERRRGRRIARRAAATREGRPVARDRPRGGPGRDRTGRSPAIALDRLRALALQPHAPDRTAHLPRIEAFLQGSPAAEIAWIADGLGVSDDGSFLARLKQDAEAHRLAIHAAPPAQLALAAPENLAGALTVKVLRPVASAPATGQVRALDLKGLPLADMPFALRRGCDRDVVRFNLPVEARNSPSPGSRSWAKARAGAVTLLDERGKRRRVGLVFGGTADQAQPLLAPTYYISRALGPFAERSR